MSTGCFIGIIPSFIDEARDSAEAYIQAINAALAIIDVPPYLEPETIPDVYQNNFFGRSALDHHSASCLVKIAELQEQNQPSVTHLGLIGLNPFRVAYVPFDFPEPLRTSYEEEICRQRVKLNVGSAHQLLKGLCAISHRIGIKIENGQVSDEVAFKINDFSPLFDGDDCQFAEDERTAWLLLYEGARLAIKHGVALSLAG